jgi:hypothetical protein
MLAFPFHVETRAGSEPARVPVPVPARFSWHENPRAFNPRGFSVFSFHWIEPARAREFLRVARAFRFPRAFPFFQSAQIVNDRVPRFPIPNRVSNTLRTECHSVLFYQGSNGLYHSRFPWIAYNTTEWPIAGIPLHSVCFGLFHSVPFRFCFQRFFRFG